MPPVLPWIVGAIVVLTGLVWAFERLTRRRRIDVGTVSESWIAQHRTQPLDSSH
jgi:hypothetical protein